MFTILVGGLSWAAVAQNVALKTNLLYWATTTPNLSAEFGLGKRTSLELTGAYNGWKPNLDSPILAAMKASYKALFGKEPAVTAIHAGLECGIIGTNYPKLDMISFGPTICYPHSPDEKVNIASVGKFYEFLVDTLKNAPLK